MKETFQPQIISKGFFSSSAFLQISKDSIRNHQLTIQQGDSNKLGNEIYTKTIQNSKINPLPKYINASKNPAEMNYYLPYSKNSPLVLSMGKTTQLGLQ